MLVSKVSLTLPVISVCLRCEIVKSDHLSGARLAKWHPEASATASARSSTVREMVQVEYTQRVVRCVYCYPCSTRVASLWPAYFLPAAVCEWTSLYMCASFSSEQLHIILTRITLAGCDCLSYANRRSFCLAPNTSPDIPLALKIYAPKPRLVVHFL